MLSVFFQSRNRFLFYKFLGRLLNVKLSNFWIKLRTSSLFLCLWAVRLKTNIFKIRMFWLKTLTTNGKKIRRKAKPNSATTWSVMTLDNQQKVKKHDTQDNGSKHDIRHRYILKWHSETTLNKMTLSIKTFRDDTQHNNTRKWHSPKRHSEMPLGVTLNKMKLIIMTFRNDTRDSHQAKRCSA
jgi:hypothetical protein